MPNYTLNTITARPEVISRLLNENGKFSFNNFIPMPEDIRNTTSGGRVDELIALYLYENNTREKAEELIKQHHISVWVKHNKSYPKHKIIDDLKERLKYHRVVDDNGYVNYIDIIKDGYGPDAKEICRKTGKDYFNNIIKFGHKDWYSWANAKWGTKWDAFDVYVDPDRKFINFTTAWREPDSIWKYICEKFPDEEIEFLAEYEDNLLVESINYEGNLVINAKYEKDFPEDYDGDYGEIPWLNKETGEVRVEY